MKKEPVCSLCSGALTKEADVWVQTSGANTLCFTFAWVCKACGASWPIGLKSGGFLKKPKPLWENGQRAE